MRPPALGNLVGVVEFQTGATAAPGVEVGKGEGRVHSGARRLRGNYRSALVARALRLRNARGGGNGGNPGF